MDVILSNEERKLLFELKTGRNKHPVNKFRATDSSLDWYKLTEDTRHILSQVVSEIIKHQFEELNKVAPDEGRLQRLKAISHKVTRATRNADNFKSKQRMLDIIEEFSNV